MTRSKTLIPVPSRVAKPASEGNGKAEVPFQDPALDVEQRIDDLLARMTLAEKVDCLSTDPSVPRLGVKGARHVEGLHGLAMGGPANWAPPVKVPTTTFPQAIGLAMTWDPALIREAAAAEAYETRYIFQRENDPKG